MSIIRSERAAAVLLLTAAALGLLAANTAIGPAVLDLMHVHLAVPGTPLDLTLHHWIADGLLAVFFFVAAIELRHELTHGELNSLSRALRPAIAAIGGVVVPVAFYLLFTVGSGQENGWPIPTATDIAFALGVLAVFGRGLPSRVRIFLLALAILDDIIAILIIAFFFTSDANLLYIVLAAVGTAAFGVLSKGTSGRWRIPVVILLIAIALVTWALVYLSGVHATIAGVALGLVMNQSAASRTRHALEPGVNGAVLPLFAFSAALVPIPQVPITQLSPAFWGIVVALPVGKIIGITLGGWIASRIPSSERAPTLTLANLVAAGALGGIGFTVSLLMNELAFADDPLISAEGTLAVLLGSSLSIVIAAVLVSRQAAVFRALRKARNEAIARSRH